MCLVKPQLCSTFGCIYVCGYPNTGCGTDRGWPLMIDRGCIGRLRHLYLLWMGELASLSTKQSSLLRACDSLLNPAQIAAQ